MIVKEFRTKKGFIHGFKMQCIRDTFVCFTPYGAIFRTAVLMKPIM